MQKLFLYKKDTLSEDIVMEVDDLYSQVGGFTTCAATDTVVTAYLGPASSGVPSGFIFHVECISADNLSGTAAYIDFSEAVVKFRLGIGASEYIFLDNLKGLTFASDYFPALRSHSSQSISVFVGGRLRPVNAHGT